MNDAAAGKKLNIEYNWTDANGKKGNWSTNPQKAQRQIRARERARARAEAKKQNQSGSCKCGNC